MTTPNFTLDELVIPTSTKSESYPDFDRVTVVNNTVEALSYGTTDLGYQSEEHLPHYNDPFNPRRILVARVDGEIVGAAFYETVSEDDDKDSAWITVQVLPEFRGRGIGTALADRAEAIATDDGRAKALAFMGVQDVPGERLAPPTGFGSVPAAQRDVRFALARGYSFEQVERISRLPLPVDGLDELVDRAAAASGPDYRALQWVGRAPEHWREDFAVLATRMSTDAPSAGLETPEDVWTVERIAAAAERDKDNPRTRLETVIEHVPSGRLVGFTVLSVPAEQGRPVDQWATLVLKEHRGHRLGMLLKVANLQFLQEVAPGHPSVITFNAEENRHMLSVNESVGFVPIGSEAAWRKDLA